MLVRLGVTSLTLMLVVSPLGAQVGARSTRRAAFTFNVTAFVGLGFRGRRAASDPGDGTCIAGTPCIDHKIGSGPAVGADLQLPLMGNFGLGVTGSISRPSRFVCVRGNCRSSRATLTALRGAAMLLLRLKARVPVYFGFGAAMLRLDPGAVVGQDDTETEYGGVLVIGYDFQPGAKVGGRVAWTSYFMSPSSNIPGGFEASGIAYDAVITIGARIGL